MLGPLAQQKVETTSFTVLNYRDFLSSSFYQWKQSRNSVLEHTVQLRVKILAVTQDTFLLKQIINSLYFTVVSQHSTDLYAMNQMVCKCVIIRLTFLTYRRSRCAIFNIFLQKQFIQDCPLQFDTQTHCYTLYLCNCLPFFSSMLQSLR